MDKQSTYSRPSLVPLLLVLAMMVAPAARAQETDTPTWGNAPGLDIPQPDQKGRSGHWWWPKGADGVETNVAYGNRGRVYGAWAVPVLNCPGLLPPPKEPPPTIPCGWGGVLSYVLFEFDRAALKKEGMAEIDKLVAEMKKYGNDTAVCIGHTDNVGSETYNFALGLRRAQAVVDYMVGAGIKAKRLSAQSRGERDPAVRNDSRANRALNRRVAFDVTVR